jgi:hypothetical protein
MWMGLYKRSSCNAFVGPRDANQVSLSGLNFVLTRDMRFRWLVEGGSRAVHGNMEMDPFLLS